MEISEATDQRQPASVNTSQVAEAEDGDLQKDTCKKMIDAAAEPPNTGSSHRQDQRRQGVQDGQITTKKGRV